MALGLTPKEIINSGKHPLLQKKEWKTVKLEDACEILDSDRIPINSTNRNKRIKGKSKEELYPYYGATGKVGWIDDYIYDGEFVLLGEDGAPFLDPLKNTAYIVKGKVWVNNHAHILKAHGSNKYLCHYLNYIDFRDYVSGTTRLKLTQTSMKQIDVLLPPLSIQHRIVEKIEELFSDLDNGVENLQKAQKQLESYKQAVLKAAFEGKLTKEWREQQDNLPTPAELKQPIEEERKQYRENQLEEWRQEVKQWEEDGKPGSKPRKPRKIDKTSPIKEEDLSESPPTPESWDWVRIGDIGKVGTGSTPLKKKKAEYYGGGNIPWVTSGALNDWYVKEASGFVTQKALEETNLTVYPEHTLLVAMYGEGKTRGKCSELLVEACTNQAVAAIVQNKTEAKTRQFLKYFFLKNYNDIRHLSSGGVQPNLNLGIIRDTLVPLPPLKEQEQIVMELESRLSIVKQLEKSLTIELNKAQSLRQSILKKAFEGRLVE